MAMFWHFSVKCNNCGHKNRPSASPRKGVRQVLQGKFTTCRMCKTAFSIIVVPERPIVVEIRESLASISPTVEFERFDGRVTPAQGLA